MSICSLHGENSVVRPRKNRFVWGNPRADFFKPAGRMLADSEIINLTFDEFEAVRLADLEGLYQEEAAKIMNISRQTFGRILQQAHQKIADSLVNGKAIKIEGGNYVTGERIFICHQCGNTWEEEQMPLECPECSNTAIGMAFQEGPFGRGPMRGRGHGRGGPPWKR